VLDDVLLSTQRRGCVKKTRRDDVRIPVNGGGEVTFCAAEEKP